ncbi:MAG: hypothetical protein P8N76_16680 [Pirellulaceae bacterium]|nr:hypothetical protein [Pirellulaceae bacterium]
MPVQSQFDQVLDFAREREANYQTRFLLGHYTIELRSFTANFHQRVLTAFCHLPILTSPFPDNRNKADLTISFWDDETTAWSTPELNSSDQKPGRVVFHDGDTRFAWDCTSRSWMIYDGANRQGYWRTPSLSTIAAHEFAAPFRTIFHWWSSDLDMQLVHAAAIGRNDGGILLVGRGGSGKSTTALSVLGSSQLGFAGDDYCLVSVSQNPEVTSLYGTGKGDADSASRIPHLQRSFHQSDLRVDGKSVVYPALICPESMIVKMPLRAVVTPVISLRTQAQLSPIGKIAALRSLAPSTLLQMPGERSKAMVRLTDLVKALPCFELQLTDNPADCHDAIDTLLTRLSQNTEL